MMQSKQHRPGTTDEIRTLWMGDVQHWMDEKYIRYCFAPVGSRDFEGRFCVYDVQVVAVKLIRKKPTGQLKGYGFIDFRTRAGAERALHACNGKLMPNVDQTFRLNWASYGFAASYQSNQRSQDNDPNNTTVFVGGLDPNTTDEHRLRHVFSQYGELIHVKISVGKRCAFVQYAIRSCAEKAIRLLNGLFVGANAIRLSWGRTPIIMQDPSAQQQPEANQCNGAGGYYYGYAAAPNYETYGYGQRAQNPNAAFYENYRGYTNYQRHYPQQ